MRRVGGRHHQARLADLYRLWLDPTRGMEEQGMAMIWIALTGFTFFVGQPNWYMLDDSGVEWTIYDTCMVARDGICLAADQEWEAYDARADAE
jgi:hypothetical protein